MTLVEDTEISECNKKNLKKAMCAALLLLPDSFNETALYEQIASLSYLGSSSPPPTLSPTISPTLSPTISLTLSHSLPLHWRQPKQKCYF